MSYEKEDDDKTIKYLEDKINGLEDLVKLLRGDIESQAEEIEYLQHETTTMYNGGYREGYDEGHAAGELVAEEWHTRR